MEIADYAMDLTSVRAIFQPFSICRNDERGLRALQGGGSPGRPVPQGLSSPEQKHLIHFAMDHYSVLLRCLQRILRFLHYGGLAGTSALGAKV